MIILKAPMHHRLDADRTSTPTAGLNLIGAIALAAALSSPLHADVVDAPGGYVLRSQGNVSVGSDADLFGSLGAAGNASVSASAVVTGEVSSGTPYNWFTPSVGSFPSAGSTNISVSKNQSLTLDAGAYGSFNGATSADLLLDAGSYVFSSFSIGSKGMVVADTSAGDVYLFVTKALQAGSETKFENSGPNNFFILTQGNASFGSKASIEAAVYSLGSQSFGSSSTLNGLTWADGNVSVGSKSTFTYAAPVPVPGAVALLGIAGVLASGRGRRTP